MRLAEHDGDLLHWFYDEGFVPGSKIEIRAAQPGGGPARGRARRDEREIGEKAAQGLYVRLAACAYIRLTLRSRTANRAVVRFARTSDEGVST